MKKDSSKMDFVKMEKDILSFWQKNDSFKKLKEKNSNSKKYYAFLDGPMTANNEMGAHHAFGRALKDIYIKYNAMRGSDIHYQNGFDAHGTPVEVQVEKYLGIKDKKELYEYGLDNFIEKCMDRVGHYSKLITKQSERIGQWMDWDKSYYTNSDSNITAIWHFLKECNNRGWLDLSYKPMMWCPRCGTSLSDHEMTGSYKDIEHKAVFFKLLIKEIDSKILVWTTTPWTLTSNVALAVNSSNDYLIVRVKSDAKPVIVGKEAIKVIKDDIIEIIREIKGSELIGLEYEPIISSLEVQKFKHEIIDWEEVDATEGTGVVHIAPGCGQEDHEIGKKFGLKEICPIDENGVFLKEFGFLSGVTTVDSSEKIFSYLKDNNKLYYTHKYEHSYPVCWRCKTEIVFRLIESWCIRVDEIRPNLKKAIENIEFQPEFLRKRMNDWLENMGDWHISRNRFYGVPLPIYPCDCGHTNIIGGREELIERSSKEEVDKIPHLHKPYMDELKIKCEKCNKKVKRIPDVGDTWLDAGITPFSTKKYFSDRDFFDKNYPVETVIEMREQIRLWFYSLLFMGVTLTGKAPYKKIVGYSAMVQEDGSKFSKSGHMIKIEELSKDVGIDPLRYFSAGANISNDFRFGINILNEIKRKLLGLWNIYAFFNTYAVIDMPDIENYIPDYDELGSSDRYMIELTNNFILNSIKNYDENNSNNIIRDFEEYIDSVSNFYIRVSRKRFWKSENKEDQIKAYYVLYTAIKKAITIMAPIIPFTSEYIWQNLIRDIEKEEKESVLCADFPTVLNIPNYENNNMITKVNFINKVISIVHRLRAENQIKVRQPLSKIYVKCSEKKYKYIKEFENIIKDELNVKKIIKIQDEKKFNTPYLTVNFGIAGRVLKKDVQKLKDLLNAMNEKEMKKLVDSYDNGNIEVHNFGKLSSELFDKKFKEKDEFVISVEGEMTLVLDINIDQALLEEGMLREIIRSAQIYRKELGLDVSDRVNSKIFSNSSMLFKLIKNNETKLMQEVLIEKIDYVSNTINNSTKIEIDDDYIQITLSKKG